MLFRSQHGLPSLTYVDANGDGLIDKNDPVFHRLRLWVDLDGDGSSGAMEVFDMNMRPAALADAMGADTFRTPMAIESIDLHNRSVKFADGGTASLQTVSLLSQVQGLSIVHDEVTDNLNVLHEDGLRENFITLSDDMSALTELQSASISADQIGRAHV